MKSQCSSLKRAAYAADKPRAEEVVGRDVSSQAQPRLSSKAALMAGLGPIPKTDLTEEVVHRFKVLLAEQRLKPGVRLLPERELACCSGSAGHH